MLRCPRPRPRGLQSPRSATLHFVQQTRSAQRNSFLTITNPQKSSKDAICLIVCRNITICTVRICNDHNQHCNLRHHFKHHQRRVCVYLLRPSSPWYSHYRGSNWHSNKHNFVRTDVAISKKVANQPHTKHSIRPWFASSAVRVYPLCDIVLAHRPRSAKHADYQIVSAHCWYVYWKYHKGLWLW